MTRVFLVITFIAAAMTALCFTLWGVWQDDLFGVLGAASFVLFWAYGLLWGKRTIRGE